MLGGAGALAEAAVLGPTLHVDGAAPARRPNIIFMLADDLGYGDLTCYGGPDIKSPHIDRLAREGVRFSDAYANSPLCSPTRAAIVTGRYQQRLGYGCEDYMGGGCPGLRPDEHPTIAMYLKAAGYKTACYGKWNVGGVENITPNAHGFDHWVGLHHNFNYFTHRAERDPDGPSHLYEDGRTIDEPGYITDLLADRAIRYIESAGPEPFFIYIPWQVPHNPLQAPDDDPGAKPHAGGPAGRHVYVKMVERLDYQVGCIMAALKRKGIDGNTLVMLTSDNGGQRAARNLPLKGRKAQLFEGGIRVPFVMRWPGVIPEGHVTSQMAITHDVSATIVGLAGARVPKEHGLDGVDLMPYATGQRKADTGRTLFWRSQDTDCRRWTSVTRSKAIREGDWKYQHDVWRGKEYLHNLREDMAEERNLLAEQPIIAERLKKKLAAWEADVTPVEANGRFNKLNKRGAKAKAAIELANLAGTIAAVSATSITIKGSEDREETTFRIGKGSSLKSVVDLKLAHIPAGTFVKVDGKLAGDRTSIEARRISVNAWRQHLLAGRVGPGTVEGNLRVADGNITVDVNGCPVAVKLNRGAMIIELNKITPAALKPGGKVFVNYDPELEDKVVNGLFYYPDRQ